MTDLAYNIKNPGKIDARKAPRVGMMAKFLHAIGRHRHLSDKFYIVEFKSYDLLLFVDPRLQRSMIADLQGVWEEPA